MVRVSLLGLGLLVLAVVSLRDTNCSPIPILVGFDSSLGVKSEPSKTETFAIELPSGELSTKKFKPEDVIPRTYSLSDIVKLVRTKRSCLTGGNCQNWGIPQVLPSPCSKKD